MPSFNDVIAGSSADSSCIQQIVDALKGTVGKGVPISITAVNDSVNWAVDVQNDEAVNSRAFRASRANGTVLIQADVNGVQVSSTGGAPATAVNISDAQTLTNKTLTNAILITPGLTSPTFNPSTGTLGSWSTFTPSITQSVAVTKTVNHAEWVQLGKIIHARARMTMTSTGTAANSVDIGLGSFAGLNANSAPEVVGECTILQGSTFFVGAAQLVAAGTVRFIISGNTNVYGITPSVGLIVGDIISFQLTMEAT